MVARRTLCLLFEVVPCNHRSSTTDLNLRFYYDNESFSLGLKNSDEFHEISTYEGLPVTTQC